MVRGVIGKSSAFKETKELSAPRVTNLADHGTMKHALDDAVVKIVTASFQENHTLADTKIALGVLACCMALFAQFSPVPFPDDRTILIVCCVSYFLLNGILQGIAMFLERDIILTTKPKEGSRAALVVRSQFPPYAEDYSIIVQWDKDSASALTHVSSVGQYFDREGNLVEEHLKRDVQRLITDLEKKKSL